jgi:hypothetical protein
MCHVQLCNCAAGSWISKSITHGPEKCSCWDAVKRWQEGRSLSLDVIFKRWQLEKLFKRTPCNTAVQLAILVKKMQHLQKLRRIKTLDHNRLPATSLSPQSCVKTAVTSRVTNERCLDLDEASSSKRPPQKALNCHLSHLLTTAGPLVLI